MPETKDGRTKKKRSKRAGQKYYGDLSAAEREQITLDPGKEPWALQSTEKSLWYGRFWEYLSFGTERSVRKTFMKVMNKPNMASNRAVNNHWRYYPVLYLWEERAAEWDAHMYQLLQEQIEDDRYQMFLRHRRQAREWADAAMDWLKVKQGHRIKSGSLALKAWEKGVDIETRTMIPPQVLKLLEMGDADLENLFEAIIATAADGAGAVKD